MTADAPVLPDWDRGCVTDLVPGLLGAGEGGPLPDAVVDAAAVVLLVIDGLGWHQLQRFASVAPTLSTLEGAPITTVAPSRANSRASAAP